MRVREHEAIAEECVGAGVAPQKTRPDPWPISMGCEEDHRPRPKLLSKAATDGPRSIQPQETAQPAAMRCVNVLEGYLAPHMFEVRFIDFSRACHSGAGRARAAAKASIGAAGDAAMRHDEAFLVLRTSARLEQEACQGADRRISGEKTAGNEGLAVGAAPECSAGMEPFDRTGPFCSDRDIGYRSCASGFPG